MQQGQLVASSSLPSWNILHGIGHCSAATSPWQQALRQVLLVHAGTVAFDVKTCVHCNHPGSIIHMHISVACVIGPRCTLLGQVSILPCCICGQHIAAHHVVTITVPVCLTLFLGQLPNQGDGGLSIMMNDPLHAGQLSKDADDSPGSVPLLPA